MEQSKRASLSVARSILNHKVIGKKLESYLKVRSVLGLRSSQCQGGVLKITAVSHETIFCRLSVFNFGRDLIFNPFHLFDNYFSDI